MLLTSSEGVLLGSSEGDLDGSSEGDLDGSFEGNDLFEQYLTREHSVRCKSTANVTRRLAPLLT